MKAGNILADSALYTWKSQVSSHSLHLLLFCPLSESRVGKTVTALLYSDGLHDLIGHSHLQIVCLSDSSKVLLHIIQRDGAYWCVPELAS